jgi:hypothetical protein
MNKRIRSRYALIIVAAFPAGCGGSQPPIGAQGAMPQVSAIAQHVAHGKSWMLPEAKVSTLVYVSGAFTKEVRVYAYPKLRLVGRLNDFGTNAEPRGLCSDKTGDVFVTVIAPNFQSFIYEYAHGASTPTNILADPGWAAGCSVDPTTGNLAVSNTEGAPSQYATVAIFANAQGTPTTYTDPAISFFLYCAYDDSGNLFVDAYQGADLIGELAAGSDAIKNITLDKKVAPGSLQWINGSLVAAGFVDSRKGEQPLYQIAINGSTGNVSGPILLWSHGNQNPGIVQYWVYQNSIIGPGLKGKDHVDLVNLWRYPHGGRPRTTRRGGSGNIGVTVSVAANR